MRKKNVLIIFGGKSVEHEVSILSARNVVAALDKEKYDVSLIGIDQHGAWHPYSEQLLASHTQVAALPDVATDSSIVPYAATGHLTVTRPQADDNSIDVVFPVLHGGMGEDGTMQGLLTLADVPFVGPGVLASAVCMDKDITKRLLRDAGLPIARYQSFHVAQRQDIDFATVMDELGLPCFIKPANAGSSVGVSKVRTEAEFTRAVELAFQYDTKILIEEQIEGLEVECSVLGNDKPIASVPGDVTPNADFYSYKAKYLDENGAMLTIPSSLPQPTQDEVRRLAVRAFEVLECEGMARVDFFVTKEGDIFIGEINTIPGFTAISMYPKLWEQSGIPYAELIDRLIELAISRADQRRQLKTSL